MVPSWLKGASHDIPPLDDPNSSLFTSGTTAQWRGLSHHAGGNGDARIKSTPSEGMISLFSFFV